MGKDWRDAGSDAELVRRLPPGASRREHIERGRPWLEIGDAARGKGCEPRLQVYGDAHDTPDGEPKVYYEESAPFIGGGSRRYRENYDLIDWTK